MIGRRSFFVFFTLLCLVPAAVFAMERDEKTEQSQTPVTCASSHPQFEAQMENTPATSLEVASTTLDSPETHQVATHHVPQLPTDLWQNILLFACQDDNKKPEKLAKRCAKLCLVCRAFNAIIMTFPAIWAATNILLNTIEHTKNFLTDCPFKDLLHVTVGLNNIKLLDASNQGTFDALKAAMAKNTKQFTLRLQDPSEKILRTLSELPCALKVVCRRRLLPQGSWHNLEILEIVRGHLQGIDFSNLTPVRKLRLADLNCLQISLLEPLPNLTHLNVEYCNNLQRLSLEQLTSLTHLSVGHCDNLQSLSSSPLP